jgi:hypothetical protein
MLERLAHWIGWTTLYHVAWTEPMAAGFRSGDMTITVRPWITSDNWKTARGVVAADNGLDSAGFVITSVTKL